MKQILKLVFLLVLGQTALAQAPSNYTNINGRYRWIAGMFDSTFHIPKGTTPSLRTGGSTNAGGLFYNTADSSVYTYTGTQWIKVRGSLNPSDTTNKYVTQVYKKSGSDSVFYVKGGNHLFAFVDSVGSPGGGGGGKVYYFNGGVNMGTIGGLQMYELGDTANTGAAANFTRSTTGNIANFITDPGKPGLLQIPAGVWSVDAWLSETGGGANHAEIWVEVEKWDGSTITTIATSPIEQITEGSTPNLYSWSVSIPTTSLTVTDRIIIQFYISNTNGKTVTLYTQNGYVGEVHTTFTTGIGAINGLTAPAQYLVTGTSGTDFNINSATATHTFNLPTASATNRGALSSADWTTFNNKGSVSSVATNNGTGITGGTITTTGTIAADTLLLSTRAWRQKGIDSVASLINTRISGTTNYIPKFTSSSAIGNSQLFDSGSSVGIATSTPNQKLTIQDGSYPILGFTIGSTAQGYIGSLAGAGIAINSQIAQPIIFYTNDTERMRLDASGNLGLGTSSPVNNSNRSTLALQGAWGGQLDIMVGSTVHAQFGTDNFNSGLSCRIQSQDGIVFNAGGATERMRITSGGNVGIGLTNPASYNANANKLVVGGTANSGITIVGDPAEGSSNLYLADGTTGDQAYRGFLSYTHSTDALAIGTAGTTRMTLDASGDLGLGLTPNTWGAGQIAFEFGTLGTLVSTGSAVSLQNNSYNNGTNNIRKVIGEASSYTQSGGAHIWQTAASGSTGSTISFSEVMRITSGGNVGIGTSTPQGRIHISGGYTGFEYNSAGAYPSYNTYFGAIGTNFSNSGSELDIWNTVGGGFAFRKQTAASTQTALMYISSTGNVGIGTTSPSEKLEVYNGAIGVNNGTIKTVVSYSSIGLVGTTTNHDLAFLTNATEKARITSGGDVSIGSTGALYALNVVRPSANAFIGVSNEGQSTGHRQLRMGFGGNGSHTYASIQGTRFGVADDVNIAIQPGGGEVYIAGTTDQGAYNLQVNGTGVWGAGAYVNGSDSALKQNIQPLDNSLDLVKQMKPVTYTYKESYSKDTSVQTGFIAQDLQVLLKDKNYLDGIVKQGPKYMSVAYQNLIPLLVKAIQELEAEIQILKNK